MLEVTIRAETADELFAKLHSLVAKLVREEQGFVRTERDFDPKSVEKKPEPVEASVPTAAPAPVVDVAARREELRALCVKVAKVHPGRTAAVFKILGEAAGATKVDDIAADKLDAAEAALRAAL